jgi:hypothetical protein
MPARTAVFMVWMGHTVYVVAKPTTVLRCAGASQLDRERGHPGPLAFVILQDVHDVTWLRTSAQVLSHGSRTSIWLRVNIMILKYPPRGDKLLYVHTKATLSQFASPAAILQVSTAGTILYAPTFPSMRLYNWLSFRIQSGLARAKTLSQTN